MPAFRLGVPLRYKANKFRKRTVHVIEIASSISLINSLLLSASAVFNIC